MIDIFLRIFSVRPEADDHVMKVLAETRLFENLSLTDLDMLAHEVELKEFAAGEIIFRRGDRGDGLYIIDAGAVEIVIADDASETVVATFLDREYFGEMAIIDDAGLRTATARARSHTRCLCLGREDFERLLSSSHVTAAKILYHLCRVLSRRLARTSKLAAHAHPEPDPVPATSEIAQIPPPPIPPPTR